MGVGDVASELTLTPDAAEGGVARIRGWLVKGLEVRQKQ